MNLSLGELRLIAQARNISDYENKSKEDLIKVVSETKPKPEPEPKIEIKVNKKKFKKLRQDFDELRHKFFKTETNEYGKAFYDTKKYKNL